MPASRSNLLILGTGFASFSLLKHLRHDLFDVTVISPRNHFLFTPLLASTTVGTIEFRSIIEPVRSARPDARYYQAVARKINLKRSEVECQSAADGRKFVLSYDRLVIGVGARSATYGIPGVEEYALRLKDLSDARAIRQRIIECLEAASQPTVSKTERQRLLHFVVVGGGPTGVEFAAEMHDFLTEDLRASYRSLMDDVRITLLEAGEHLLGTFDHALSSYTTRLFHRQHIEVRTRSFVTRITKNHIRLKDASTIPFGLVVWSTGIAPTPLVLASALPKDSSSRILVDEYLKVKGLSGVYAAGDCVAIEGKMIPATAQVAQQEGTYLAKALAGEARGISSLPFHYKHYGMLAYIGSGKALADLSTIKGRGFSAWLFWRSVYITRLVSMKNKVLVIFDWMKTFVFGRDISRF